MARIEVNGLTLNVESRGAGPALLLLHGFTGSSRTWEPFAEAWPGTRTIAVDIIGHGESDSPPNSGRYSIDRCLADLAAVLDILSVDRCAVLGYSMGGRIALRFALTYPDRVRALILESASPGIDDDAGRAARVRADRELAVRIERDGLPAFVDYWEALALWASQVQLPAGQRAELRRQRLQSSPAGLANSLRGMGAGADEALMERLPSLRMPVLLIAGALDAKYRDLAKEMAPRLRDGRIEIIGGAGHAAHLEKPDEFARLVGGFLKLHGAETMEVPRA